MVFLSLMLVIFLGKAHGHMLETCKYGRKDVETPLTLKKIPYEEANALFDRDIENVKKFYPLQVQHIDILWECQFDILFKNDPNWKLFQEVCRPNTIAKQRLRPRDAVLSSLNFVYKMKWIKNQNPGKTLMYLGKSNARCVTVS